MCLSWENGLPWGEGKWYYDYAAEPGPGVPESIVRRVRRYLVFRKQIDCLQEAVTGAGGEANASRSKMKRDIIDTLSGHFRCLNEQVTCARVKPFLPGLLLPSALIRIPTPITVHVDHCPECADDLEALRDLGLSPEQLERLEQLYQGPAARRRRLCRKARSRIGAFVRGSLDGIERELLDHLCTCARCRSRVYRSRQKLLERRANSESRAVGPDVDIAAAQIFDYAVPYGRASGGALPVGATLMQTGRACLQRIQELDETIYGIAERTDSGIATIYRTVDTDVESQREAASVAENTDTPEIAQSYSDPYPGYPIHVQVIRGRPQEATPAWSPAEIKARWKRATCDPQVRFVLKAAVAAAAIIPLAVLFFNTSTASGITLAQMFKAFGRAQNIHVATFDPPTGRLTQQFWISREMNRLLMTTGEERVLYDLEARKKNIYQTAERPTDVGRLSEQESSRARRLIDTCLGFTLSDIPTDKKWRRIHKGVAEGFETYELIYSGRNRSGTSYLMRWEIDINPATGLPGKVQAFWRGSAETEWQCRGRVELQYLPTDEMAAIIGSR
ncbi:MAG: hypothetical protein M1376_22620 [Planctomycetes bacterium]|nr:hypothetical protein [Planctomycetota bacterium]